MVIWTKDYSNTFYIKIWKISKDARIKRNDQKVISCQWLSTELILQSKRKWLKYLPLKKTKKVYLFCKWIYNLLIGLVGRVFANSPGDLDSIPRSCQTKDFKNGTWYFLAWHSTI